MSQHSKTTETNPSSKNTQTQSKTPLLESQVMDITGMAKRMGDLVLSNGDDSIQAQAAQLRDSRLQTAQRQALASHIASVQGNHHLQRVIASLNQDRQTAPNHPTRLLASRPGDASEQEAQTVANQVVTGEPVQVKQSPTANLYGNWLSDIGNAVGDALNTRDNEATLDEWEDYQDSMEELREFKSATHKVERFQSTTRIGLFDAIYDSSNGSLKIVIKCKFNFVNGNATEFPGASAADLTWADEAAKTDWKSRFISKVSTTWSSGNHVFYCQKEWWESLVARVVVEVHEVEDGEHFALTIAKIPAGQFRQSSVSSPVSLPLIGPIGSGSGDFDSEDLNTVAKPGGMQTPATHEAGHMLGLDDEYVDPGSGTPSHSDLVESEFGHGVARGSDGRIMSGGNDIQPEHGITFLEALKEATGKDEWTATMCPVPKPIPHNPNGTKGMGDFPMPSSDTRPA